MSKPNISLIVATDKKNIIAVDGKIPWHILEDLKRFRDLTIGHPVIMGRKTYESLPEKFRPLPGRSNIVLSHIWHETPKVLIARSPENAIDIAQTEPGREEIFVIGGATVYRLFLKWANRIYWSLVNIDCQSEDGLPHRYDYFPLDLNQHLGWNQKWKAINSSHDSTVPACIFMVLDR